MNSRTLVFGLIVAVAALPAAAQQDSAQQIQQLQAAMAAQQRQFAAERQQMQRQLDEMARAMAEKNHAQTRAFQAQMAQQTEAARKLQQALQDADAARYNTALAQIKQLEAQHAGQSDSNLYWQAYMQSRMGQNQQALQSLDRLQLQSPQSTWKPDAQALRLQLLQARVLRDGGDRVVLLDQPKLQPNDDLKLLAINGLMQSDPQQAIPMLTQVIEGNTSPAVKNRALFVLAQSGTTSGLNELVHVAQTTKDPALAANAVRYIGFYDSKGTEALIQIARGSAAPQVRNQAIRSLGVNGSPTALAALPGLYPGAADRELSRVVIRTLVEHDQAAALVGLARKEKDPELKRELVSDLSQMHSKPATDYLLELLRN